MVNPRLCISKPGAQQALTHMDRALAGYLDQLAGRRPPSGSALTPKAVKTSPPPALYKRGGLEKTCKWIRFQLIRYY